NGINDSGQIAGGTTPFPTTLSQAFLFTPSTPNGSGGTTTAFLSSQGGSSIATAINNYGQMIGFLNTNTFLWTPATPNGSSGSLNTNQQLQGVNGINNFGQAVMNQNICTGNCDHPVFQTTLFTPSAANAPNGNISQLPGLVGSTNNMLQAINSGGTV